MNSTAPWKHHLPFLQWPRLTPALFRGEMLAGVTVGLMLVPQGIAYAHLAGMPLVAGLYASLLPAMIAVLFSASPRLSVGPTALSCLLVSASLAGLAEPGSPGWIELAAWLSLMSGVLQIGVGLLRAGWLLSLVNAPVLMAFTQGAGLLIIGSQVLTLLGLPNDWSRVFSDPTLHLPSLAFGVGSYVALAMLRKWSRTFPSVLVLVVVAATISAWTGFEASGGRVIGDLPTGLPPIAVPSWPGIQTFANLLLPALMITLVSFLETASSARIDSRDQAQRWNREQDLIGHGMAKMAAGISGAFPTSTSFSRSVLNRYAGARTGWSVIFSSVVVALALIFTPMLHAVPMPVLAAIVVVAVQSLLVPSEFIKLWRISRVEAGIAVVTFVITVLSAPRLYWGVLAGIVMSLSRFLFLHLNPRIIEVGLHPDGSLRDRHLWNLPPLAPSTYAMRMDSDLNFASANDFERNVSQYLSTHADTRHLILIAHPINQIDATGVETLGSLLAQLKARDITVHLVGLKQPVERPLRSAGLLDGSEHLKTYRTESDMLTVARDLALPVDVAASAT